MIRPRTTPHVLSSFAGQHLFAVVLKRLVIALIVSSFVTSPLKAAKCLQPNLLDDFVTQQTLQDVERFQQLIRSATGDEDICPRRGGSICPEPGFYVHWSNNAATYAFGPVSGGEDRANRYLAQLHGFKANLVQLYPDGDFGDVTVGFWFVREGECLPIGLQTTSGSTSEEARISPQLQVDMLQQRQSIARVDGELEQLQQQFDRLRSSIAAGRPLTPAQQRSLQETAERAGALADELKVELLNGLQGPPPLGRVGNGLVELITQQGFPGPTQAGTPGEQQQGTPGTQQPGTQQSEGAPSSEGGESQDGSSDSGSPSKAGGGDDGKGGSGGGGTGVLPGDFARWLQRLVDAILRYFGVNELAKQIAFLAYLAAPEVFEEISNALGKFADRLVPDELDDALDDATEMYDAIVAIYDIYQNIQSGEFLESIQQGLVAFQDSLPPRSPGQNHQHARRRHL